MRSSGDLVARLDRTSAHEHAAAIDRRLDAVARAVLHPQREEFVEPHRLLPPVDVDREVFVELVSLLHLAAVGLGLAPQRLSSSGAAQPCGSPPHSAGRSSASPYPLPAIGPSSKKKLSSSAFAVRRRAATPRHGGAPRPRPANRRVRPAGAPAPRSTPAPACPKRRFRVPPSPASSVRRSPTSNPLPSHIPARAAGRETRASFWFSRSIPRRRRPLLR